MISVLVLVRGFCLMPSLPVSPPEPSAAQASVVPHSQTDVFPGAWPLEDTSISPESQSQSTPHLDRVLSFHKRFSWSFSSPILMPVRSPLLSPSISEPGGLAVGQEVCVPLAFAVEFELMWVMYCSVILARHLYLC